MNEKGYWEPITGLISLLVILGDYVALDKGGQYRLPFEGESCQKRGRYHYTR
jgi:hypothetical protein